MPRLAVLVIIVAAFAAPEGADGAAPAGVENAVRRGVAFLKAQIPGNPGTGHSVIAALAVVKADEPVDGREVQSVLAAIEKRCEGDEYKPEKDHYYTAGLELMLMEAVDPERYREPMEKILAYILAGQRTSGGWHYPDKPEGQGDTSITQYAALGLWAAERAGLDVPKEAWDKMAAWHLRTQVRDGGFAYHPGGPDVASTESRPTLALGGAANLLLARLHLFRSSEMGGKSKAPAVPTAREEQTGKRFGVLEAVDIDAASAKKPNASDRRYSPQVRADGIEQSVSRAVAYSTTRFKLPPDGAWKMYYMYALERMAALGDMQTLGNYDWYAEGAKWVVSAQTERGSWTDFGGETAGTAFGVMFLTKSTSKMLGRAYDVPGLGGGLLAGGRGLPDDLNAANVAGGSVKTRKSGGALDELLARLEGAQATDVPGVQEAVLEAIRFGDRETLLGQQDRIRKLAADPRAEVRRTAYWALGRGGDLADVPRLLKGLADPDASVAVEAHNALCVLSRRPLAFGIPGDPFAGLPENAPDENRQRALTAWRDRAMKSWTEWYRRVAPYDERDGLGVLR